MVRDYPALLAWNTNDERRNTEQLARMYDLYKTLDPEHPTLHVQNHAGYMEEQPALTDIIAPDPYPVGHRDAGEDLTLTSKVTQITTRAVRNQNPKGVWVVPQIFDWHSYLPEQKSHQPSLDEMRNQAYQALIHGAKGLVFYSYFDLKYIKYRREKDAIDWDVFHERWGDVAAMAQELKNITPIILQDKQVPLTLPDNAKIEAAAWQDGEELVMLLANPYYEQNSITFKLPDGWQIKDATQGQIKSTFANGEATFTLPSVGSGVFYLVKG